MRLWVAPPCLFVPPLFVGCTALFVGCTPCLVGVVPLLAGLSFGLHLVFFFKIDFIHTSHR